MEIVAAIFIIGLASSTLTSMIMSSYSGTLKAEQYVLAREIARTYDSLIIKEITKEKIKSCSIDEQKQKSDATNNYFTTICGSDASTSTVFGSLVDTSTSYTYKALFNSASTTPIQLNNNVYDHNNVKVEIQIYSKTFGYYTLKTSVSYLGKEVTYEAVHLAE